MSKRHTSSILVPNFGGTCDMIAAAEAGHESLVPDQWVAYARVHFAKTLPMVVGPESISGQIFGLHPAVVARSFPSVRHKGVNMGHTLRVLNKKEDRYCGCILSASFPDEPEGGWVIPDTIEEAPEISVVSALWKQAHGVPKMLGDHLGGKVKMSVSLEMTYYYDEMGLYDPSTKTAYDRKDIPTSLRGYVYEDNDGKLMVRKNSRNPALVILLGGVSGNVWFTGYGYTDRPAESTAGIDSIAASVRRESGVLVCGTADAVEFAPGMEVRWPGGEYGRGRVIACHFEGRHIAHGKTLLASAETPVLEIRLPNQLRIIRRASSVTKKS